MARKIYKPEEIIAKLRQVEVLTSQGPSAVDGIRSIGVTDATDCRWRQDRIFGKSGAVVFFSNEEVIIFFGRSVRMASRSQPPGCA